MAFQGVLGLIVFLAAALVMGERGSEVALSRKLKIAAAGLAVQIALALVLLKFPPVQHAFIWLNGAVGALQAASEAGTGFVFGYLGGGPLPFEESQPGASFILAFRALPLILVMSALSALLFHWRVLPVIVRGFSKVLEKSLRIGGAVGVATAANVFVGMVEAPLLIRPFVAKLTRSELFVVMTCGMATIAGTMMVIYATVLGPVVPDALGHLLTASMMNVPAAITVALLMVPDEGPPTPGTLDLGQGEEPHGAMDAVVRGTLDGVGLLINVIAMLVVLVALVHLVNQIMGLLPDAGGAALTMQRVLGWALSPVAWLMGLPWAEAGTGGALLGTKIVLNEFIAYLDMAALPKGALGEGSRLIMAYAMCGFANLGSLGIMIGGLATIAPERRAEVVALGPKSIIAATLATYMTGAVVGLLL
ncbi:MAG: nucleoside:proton symporter [Rhodospirillales bacterium]|nr:nucleoside:proton symporter [Rhodospirillales bacterium]